MEEVSKIHLFHHPAPDEHSLSYLLSRSRCLFSCNLTLQLISLISPRNLSQSQVAIYPSELNCRIFSGISPYLFWRGTQCSSWGNTNVKQSRRITSRLARCTPIHQKKTNRLH